MIRRRRSPLRYLIPALVVGVALWWAKIWPFRQAESPPPAKIPAVGDRVREAYEALAADFREKIPLTEFAGMYLRMADPDSRGALPKIRRAQVIDATGPEHPQVRFSVEYPGAKTRVENHFAFARVDGAWRLWSFSRVTSDPSARPASPKLPARSPPPPAASAVTPTPGDKKQPAVKAEPGKEPRPTKSSEPPAPALPKAKRPSPRYYVIQQGDTLGSISRHFYGTTRYWRRILEANPGLDERRLRIGRRILIPSLPELPPPSERKATDAKPSTATP